MVIGEVSTLTTSIQSAFEIVKSLKSSYDARAITQAQSDILEQLFTIRSDALTLQEKHLALINEKEELTKKLMEFEQWAKTESEYDLKEIIPDVFVYSSKISQNSKMPTHWLCPNCWEDRKKSIFQRIRRTSDGNVYLCYRCKYDFFIHKNLIH